MWACTGPYVFPLHMNGLVKYLALLRLIFVDYAKNMLPGNRAGVPDRLELPVQMGHAN